MKYEVGVVSNQGVVTMMFKEALRVWRTWRFAKRNGLPADKWYGVYQAGTEIVMVTCGPLPGAQQRAEKICDLLSTS